MQLLVTIRKKKLIFELQLVKIEGSPARNARLVLSRVSLRVSGFAVSIGKLQKHIFFEVSYEAVMSFHVAGVTLCDTPFHTLHFRLHTPHFTLHTLHPTHYTLYTLHFTSYTPRSTLYIYTLQATPHSTLYTLLHTLRSTHSTLHTPQSRCHNPHFTLHTPHSTLYTP